MNDELSRGSKGMSETVIYGVLAALALAWLWHSKFESGPNAGEAFGFDLVSIGLPLALLIVASKNFLKNYRLWKSKSGSGILLFLLSAIALLCRGWIVAVVLALVGVGFTFATRQRGNIQSTPEQ